MFTAISAFSGFSVDDLDAAHVFYRETLGLSVDHGGMGLMVSLPGGASVLVYPKPDHTPASFTVLNFVVEDIDAAVAQLNDRGVPTKIYDDSALPTDDRGIARGKSANRGPDIAWFRDPAGNVLAVLQN